MFIFFRDIKNKRPEMANETTGKRDRGVAGTVHVFVDIPSCRHGMTSKLQYRRSG